MTTVKMTVSENDIFFECVNHANSHDECLIYSTLCNVLVSAVLPYGIMPKVYEPGHVVIVAHKYVESVLAVFHAVWATFVELRSQYNGVKLIGVDDFNFHDKEKSV